MVKKYILLILLLLPMVISINYYGDCNNNSIVGMEDITLIEKVIFNSTRYNCIGNGDISRDGIINNIDILMIENIIKGITNPIEITEPIFINELTCNGIINCTECISCSSSNCNSWSRDKCIDEYNLKVGCSSSGTIIYKENSTCEKIICDEREKIVYETITEKEISLFWIILSGLICLWVGYLIRGVFKNE